MTEDWRWRMMTPPKGDVSSLPVTAEGRKTAESWDPARDIAAGEQCRPYGAAGIMRLPVRLHVTRQDDSTLTIDIDNGTQTRLLHFDPHAQAPSAAEWQEFSIVRSESVVEGQGQGRSREGRPRSESAGGKFELTSFVENTQYLQIPLMLTALQARN